VGDTVRRPRGTNSAFVQELLGWLQERGFDGAPRHVGSDEQGRDMFTFVPGDVPSELDAALSDAALRAAARLIRRFHDATAGSRLAGHEEVVCHNDLSPCNFVFRDGLPVAIIDFDAAKPGARLDDVGYALFLWLNVGTDGPPVMEQARRIEVFCGAYGLAASAEVVDAIIRAVTAILSHLRKAQRLAELEWWEAQSAWLAGHRQELADNLRQHRPR
jgi:aminoglycoside phosphotransferase (APT) family kinase protein